MRSGRRWLLVAALACAAAAHAQRLYRWIDDAGVVHYSDSVPPEYADRDRNVMNRQGVRIGFEEGETSPEERARLEAQRTEDDAVALALAEQQRRDRMLLETYLSVQDIEDLRDRRLELIESKVKVTNQYLANLRKRLATLQAEASRYKPYATEPDAAQIPENLSVDLARTAASIASYEQTLVQARADQESLKAAFAKDIERFRQLEGT